MQIETLRKIHEAGNRDFGLAYITSYNHLYSSTNMII